MPLFAQGKSKIAGLAALLVLLAAAGAASLIYGRTEITVSTAVEAFKHYDEESTPHIVLRTERLPRTVIAAVVGASLAVAGALMQALTRNPLASPSVFGINAGAIFLSCLQMWCCRSPR